MAKKDIKDAEDVVRNLVNTSIGDSVFEFLDSKTDNILNVIMTLGCSKDEAVAIVAEEVEKVIKEYEDKNELRRTHGL